MVLGLIYFKIMFLISSFFLDYRKTMTLEEILNINIKPGWKKGTKITFPEKGNEQPNVIPADLVFVKDEKPHNTFTRDDNDLVVTRRITLAEALIGYTVHVTIVDGRNLIIPINNVIHPDYEEIVPKEGMPISKGPTKKGDLRIKFNVKFHRCTTFGIFIVNNFLRFEKMMKNLGI
ncbi:putative chaperone DnaJ, HSP40/DnaJ peptide-binding protein [Helianthus anomalus]